MPRKPTRPFGYINFGKDGTVEKVLTQLSHIKEEQETEVAVAFAAGLEASLGQNFAVERCAEADHDFYLISGETRILVQAVEIVGRDFLVPIDANGRGSDGRVFDRFQIEGDVQWGMDDDAREGAILARIKLKLAKHYSKPACPLWLLIWSVESFFFPFFGSEGKIWISPGVAKARTFLSQKGSGPFDEIWVKPILGRPHRIWPITDDARVRQFGT